ncbi:MAG: radical SAM protein [Promethearchaeota archaeon]
MSHEKKINIRYQKIPRDFIERYTKTHYRVIGKYKHTALKPCHWLEQKLLTGRENRNCYKGYWGVESERCIQNTPAYPFCNHSCVFCWRDTSTNLDNQFSVKADDPVYLVKELIKHQKNFISYSFPLKRNLETFRTSMRMLEVFVQKYKGVSSAKKGIDEGSDKDAGNHPKENLLKLPNSEDTAFNHEILSTALTFEDLMQDAQIKLQTKSTAMRAFILLKSLHIIESRDLKRFYLSPFILEFIEHESSDVNIITDKFISNEQDIINSFNKALNPNHTAISLDGEPTLYPYLGELIAEFRKRRFTTFVVSNGTRPDVISLLNETGTLPSILYITLPPPSIEEYKKICRPRVKGTWESIMKTLDMLKDLKTRTVLRITSIKNLNIKEEQIKSYVKILERVQPDFLDIKGFTLEAGSLNISKRLGSKMPVSYYFPKFDDLMNFARKLEEMSGYKIIRTHEPSRDILIRVKWPKEEIKLTESEI